MKRSRWTKFRSVLTKWLGWVWQPLLFAGVLLGFLLARALSDSQGHLAPLGIAFYAAVRGAGYGGPGALAVAVAVVAGGAGVAPQQLLWIGLSVASCHMLAPVFRLGRNGPTPLAAAAVAAIAVVGPATVVWGRSNFVPIVFVAGVAAVMALVFTMGIAQGARGRIMRAGTGEVPISVIVLLGTALCGVQGMVVGPGISLRDVAAGLVVLACAYAGGAASGAAAGAVLAVVLLVSNFGLGLAPTPEAVAATAPLSMTYVVAGMVAGTFRDLRKVGVGVAYCLGFLTYAAATLPRAPDLLVVMFSAVTATVLFWLIPRSWLGGFPLGLRAPLPAPVTEPNELGGQSPGMVERIAGMSQVFKEVSRTFEHVATVEVQSDTGPRRAFEQVAERVCTGCSMYRHCWEKEFERTYQLYGDLWTQIDRDGPLRIHSVPDALEQNCIRPDQVAFTLNYLADLHRSHHVWERRLDEGRTVVADYLRNMARMLDRFVDEVEREVAGGPRLEVMPTLRVVSRVARMAKKGSHISGDSYAAEPIDGERYLMALSDGMGVGSDAATESKQCVTLLRDILKAGFTTDVAVRTVNSVLLLRSPEESFATVDLTLVDLGTGRAEFVKVGAAPSFIKRGHDVTLVRMSSVPVGIIHQVEVEPEFRTLKPGDLLVMITDGVWDVAKLDRDKERWLLDYLRRDSSVEPEELAESILARTVELMPEVTDDLTVLVARIDPVDGGPTEPARQAVRQPAGQPASTPGAWAPVRRAPGHTAHAVTRARSRED